MSGDYERNKEPTGENVVAETKTNAGTRKLPMTEDVYELFQAIIEDCPTFR